MRFVRFMTATVMALALVMLPRPAAACACGAVVSSSSAVISGETALVVWDGSRETISMAMVLDGSAADAGWIMPVPAGTDVSLGDKTVFPTLLEATKPEHRTLYDFNPLAVFMVGAAGGAAPGGPAVRVDKVATIGPFQVTWLSGTDAAAVASWLTAQGYPTRTALIPTFQAYLDRDWRILAVKLLPSAGELSGTLDPLDMTFAATEPVYPILLSKHAAQVQGVNLYVAAAHRMDISRQAAPHQPLVARFAGRVPADVAGLATGLGPQSGPSPTVYLTAYSGYLYPESITDDFGFATAADDTPYRAVITTTVWLGWVTWLGLVAIVASSVVAVGVGYVRARRPAGPSAAGS